MSKISINIQAGVNASNQAGFDAYKRGDYETALKEFLPLAEQGLALAQFNLGFMYGQGEGVPKDYVLAHMWANLAAAQGNENAIKSRDILEKLMIPTQLAQANGWPGSGC